MPASGAAPMTRYCPQCGATLEPHVVGGELRNHWRCTVCARLHYDHPMIVVTTFIACNKRLLWVQRALPPKVGSWAIPGGFLEQDETLAEGAARELREEAGVVLPASALSFYMMGTITFINQVYVAFRARVNDEALCPGPESLDAGFFSREECPWGQVAYPEVNDSIFQAYDDLESGRFDVWHTEMTAERYQRHRVRELP
ncbi:MAG: NUDIX hydrolase [Halieaceae bacterium]|uniref:NUDIX hydrolase n=1 Tax=Haliea alexandrii TaxID=2448162 RepID=UPI001304A6EA|nr:NUDIX hydrolase [Haliea alexandrii]MCR9187124.1 NUDIX hydrolase [Halieaceae bacterium]